MTTSKLLFFKNRFVFQLSTVISITLFSLFSGCMSTNQPPPETSSIFVPKEGDIIFQESRSDKFSEAVQSVTSGYNGAKVSHVGIIFYSDGIPYVLEAKDEIETTPLSIFLSRSLDKNGHSRAFVARLIPKYRSLIPKAIQIGLSLVGLPYNEDFNIKSKKSFYCSQLIYYCFKRANNNVSIFKLTPMTFNKPGTSKPLDVWQEYFKKLNVPIPEGKPGISPGSMSRSKNLEVIHFYGSISGMNKNLKTNNSNTAQKDN